MKGNNDKNSVGVFYKCVHCGCLISELAMNYSRIIRCKNDDCPSNFGDTLDFYKIDSVGNRL